MTRTVDIPTDNTHLPTLSNTPSGGIKNIFGTDGIRATVATAPFTLEHLARLGYAIGIWARKKYALQPLILIAHDTRVSCSFIQSALESGLLLHPVALYKVQVLPTPIVYYLVRTAKQYTCGIIISASHNPYQDNGIKIIDSHHGKLGLDDEMAISMLFATTTTLYASYDQLGISTYTPNAHTAYCNYIQSAFPQHFLHGLTIVLDCAHGATTALAPDLFRHFGAHVISINDHPNGTNINDNCGTLYTDSLKKAVLFHNAAMGFAFDGDGDRVIAINRHGKEKNGDDILAILLQHPTYAHMPLVVGTIMTNQGLEKQLEKNNKQLIRAQVGDKYVAQELEKYNLLLGGEQSGHIVMRDFLESGDGIATALKIAHTLCLTGNWDMHSYDAYPQILVTLPVVQKNHDLSEPVIVRIINEHRQLLVSGRVLVRYSGTENSVRIMVEDETMENANIIAQQLARELDALFKKL